MNNFNTKVESVVHNATKPSERKFTPNPVYEGEAPNSVDSLNSLNIYYRTAEIKPTDMDMGDITDYFWCVVNPMNSNRDTKIKFIEANGYADAVGSPFDNSVLAEKRAALIGKKFNSSLPGVPVYITSFGESQSTGGENPLERKVTVSLNKDPVSSSLDKAKAKIYLIDQSGSMKDIWEFIQNYNFPTNAIVYAFSHNEDKTKKEAQQTYDLQTSRPWGKTCIYDGADVLLDEYSDSEITIMVNGYDNVSKKKPYEIISKAKKKNDKLNIIGINLDKKTMKEYTHVSTSTGGSRFFFRKF